MTKENVAQSVAELTQSLSTSETLYVERDGRKATVMLLPKGKEIRSIKPFLDEYLDRPERIVGIAVLTDLESFCAHTIRFKIQQSAIFADGDRCKLTTMFDYHANEATPAFGQHRAEYGCPMSEAWTKWQEFSGEARTQEELAEFLEDQIMDIGVPARGEPEFTAAFEIAEKLHKEYALPNKLLELSQKLALTVEMKVGKDINRQTGETVLAYSEEHKDAVTGEKLKVPGLFLLSIPVFENGAIHHVPARLRYRVKNGTITWAVELYRPDLAVKEAFDTVCREAVELTGLPLYRGAPES